MPTLNLDILYEIVNHLDAISRKDRHEILCRLAITCYELNEAVRSILFRQVKWPQGDKHDENGLLFFPECLWPFIRDFHLDWPGHWPDVFPPLWGTKHILRVGEYHPQGLHTLERALSGMSNIRVFQITCPFYPPLSLMRALVGCPNIKDLRIVDTPLSTAPLPPLPDTFNLERITLVPVGEAIRVGEGPYDKKYRELAYFTCGYRKRHGGETNLEFMGYHHLSLGRTECLKYLQLSSKYTHMELLASAFWPELETLILTGPTPSLNMVPLVDVIGRMPKLRDLRVLFAKPNRRREEGFSVLGNNIPNSNPNSNAPAVSHWRDHASSPGVLSKIKYIALSDAYDTQDFLRHASSLERLSISAIMAHPRIPIALNRAEVLKVLQDLKFGGGNVNMKRMRLMTEEELDFGLFEEIGRVCPSLEFLEVELCGYREDEAGHEWTDYGDVFAAYEHLQELRVGIPFAGCEEPCGNDPKQCIRSDRKYCAIYIASRVPTLRRIGFEYRLRTGSHRNEDRWLDYDIIRLNDGNIRLCELGQTWYPLPEVWDAVPLCE